jgi:HSP90 family molecular chaperone
LIEKYSQFVDFPIFLRVERQDYFEAAADNPEAAKRIKEKAKAVCIYVGLINLLLLLREKRKGVRV